MTKRKEVIEYFKYAVSLFKSYKIILCICITLLIVETICAKLQPYFLGNVIDRINRNSNITSSLFIIICLYLVGSTVSFFSGYNLSKITNNIIFDLKKKVFKNIIHMEINEMERISSGELFTRFENDVNSIGNAVLMKNIELITGLINVIFIGFIIFSINIHLSIYILFMFPFSYGLAIYGGKCIKKYISKYKSDSEKYTSFFNETISNMQEIKTLMCETVIKTKMNQFQVQFLENVMKKIKIEEIMKYLSSILYAISTSGFIIIGYLNIKQNKLTIGEFISFNSYFFMFYSALRSLISIYPGIQESIVSINRIRKKISEFNDEAEKPANQTLEFKNIQLQNVEFQYNDNYIVLKGITIKFEKNKVYAIIGSSGEGKSTIFNLLVKFYPQYRGSIFIDDVNLCDIDKGYLREHICLVRQEPSFFNDTIKNNLLLANPDATDTDIMKVCEYVGLGDLIKKLPEKINTNIYEQSKNISIGEKQRLAIARGLLKDSKVFLLDEITSSIDGRNKNKIIELVEKLKKDKIVILVTHDQDVMKKVDVIAMIKNGEINCFGSWDEICNLNQIQELMIIN